MNRNRYAANATDIEEKIAQSNQYSEAISRQIISVLAATCGKDLATPKQWWDWWRDRNEYYTSDHPVDQQYYSDTDRRYYGQPVDIVTMERVSCFAKGTPVWTKTGQVPVESVELGDFVLSQDVNTGELTYKPVLAKTVRPPSKMLTISLDGEQITATLGHPFWVAGTGWRMAKELGDDARLHGISGSSRVRSVTPTAEAEAYNLVVAEYNTYFVGESGILVHDNTPRQSTQAIVPGVAKK